MQKYGYAIYMMSYVYACWITHMRSKLVQCNYAVRIVSYIYIYDITKPSLLNKNKIHTHVYIHRYTYTYIYICV